MTSVGPTHDKGWFTKVDRIVGLTGKNRNYVHDALMYYNGNADVCGNDIMDNLYVPKEKEPMSPGTTTVIDTT